jgi:hypothetical protein
VYERILSRPTGWQRSAALQLLSTGWRPKPYLSNGAVAKHYAGRAEEAVRIYVALLEVEPDNTTLLDVTAALLAELGESWLRARWVTLRARWVTLRAPSAG